MELVLSQEILYVPPNEVHLKEVFAIRDYERRGYRVIDLRHVTGMEAVEECIGTNFVAARFHSCGRYGAPDLFVWNEQEWFFVEVKLAPDTVRLQQILWFAMNRLPVRLLWLVEDKPEERLTIGDRQLEEMIERVLSAARGDVST